MLISRQKLADEIGVTPDTLRGWQQLDADGCMVGVSRQALDEMLRLMDIDAGRIMSEYTPMPRRKATLDGYEYGGGE